MITCRDVSHSWYFIMKAHDKATCLFKTVNSSKALWWGDQKAMSCFYKRQVLWHKTENKIISIRSKCYSVFIQRQCSSVSIAYGNCTKIVLAKLPKEILPKPVTVMAFRYAAIANTIVIWSQKWKIASPDWQFESREIEMALKQVNDEKPSK